jgi:hypothetical protein
MHLFSGSLPKLAACFLAFSARMNGIDAKGFPIAGQWKSA